MKHIDQPTPGMVKLPTETVAFAFRDPWMHTVPLLPERLCSWVFWEILAS